MRIVVDFDGTIVACEARQMAVLSAVASRHKVCLNLRSVWEHKRAGLNTRDALVLTGIPNNQSSALQAEWMSEIEDIGWLSLDKLFPGVRAALGAWSSSGNSLTLLSARSRGEWLTCQVRNLGIRKYFESIVCVDPLQAVAQKSKVLVDIKADIFIGDTEADYESASLARTEFIAVSCGQRNRDFLATRGCSCIVDSIASGELILNQTLLDT
jgi:phosphoglycolate phosphatase-like HAD superfamily hydrolase